MLRIGLTRKTVTNYLPSELKAKPRGVQVAAAKTGTGIREIFSQNPKPRRQQQSIVQFNLWHYSKTVRLYTNESIHS